MQEAGAERAFMPQLLQCAGVTGLLPAAQTNPAEEEAELLCVCLCSVSNRNSCLI